MNAQSMLRQLLSISGPLTAHRSIGRALLSLADFSTTADHAPASPDQSPGPIINKSPAAAAAAIVHRHRSQTRSDTRPTSTARRKEDDEDLRGSSKEARYGTTNKPHSFAAGPTSFTSNRDPRRPHHQHQRPNIHQSNQQQQQQHQQQPQRTKSKPAWYLALHKATTTLNYPECYKILEGRSQFSPSVATSFAFERTMRALPPHQGLKIFQLAQSRGVVPTVGMVVNVIRIYAAMGMLRHVESTVKEFIAAGVRHHWSIYFHWAAVFAEAGQPEGVTAAAAAAEAAGLEVTAHYQTMMVKALCKSGKPGRTLSLLRELRQAGQIPPEPVWRALIHCHGQAGHAHRSQALFDEMKELGIVPGLATWTALVNAYAECRMPRQAVDTLAGMHAAGIRGNTQTYTVLLKACAHAGDVAAAQGAVEQMRRDGLEPTVHVWGALIAACAAAGDTSAARAAFAAMQESGCPAGIVQYTALLTAYRHAGDIAGGLQVLKEMDADQVKPGRETFTEIITLLGQHSMIGQAEEAFQAMRSQGYAPDQIAFNVLVGALMTNWVDEGRNPNSPLILRAEEVFKEGWQLGTTRPPKELTPDGRLLRIDLHCQGTWSAQFAVLNVLAELAATTLGPGETHPALMLITGHGLKKGWAPLRETVWTMLRSMGMSVRVALGNGGTLIVPHWDVQRAIKNFEKQGRDFEVTFCHESLIDPREIVGQQDLDENNRWGRTDQDVDLGLDSDFWGGGEPVGAGAGAVEEMESELVSMGQTKGAAANRG
jgi:pentatricopeptide repeat protein